MATKTVLPGPIANITGQDGGLVDVSLLITTGASAGYAPVFDGSVVAWAKVSGDFLTVADAAALPSSGIVNGNAAIAADTGVAYRRKSGAWNASWKSSAFYLDDSGDDVAFASMNGDLEITLGDGSYKIRVPGVSYFDNTINAYSLRASSSVGSESFAMTYRPSTGTSSFNGIYWDSGYVPGPGVGAVAPVAMIFGSNAFATRIDGTSVRLLSYPSAGVVRTSSDGTLSTAPIAATDLASSPADTKVLGTVSGVLTWVTPSGGGGGADANGSYLTVDATNAPTNYRAIVAGTGVSITDNAGAHTFTIAATGALGALNIATTGTLSSGAATVTGLRVSSLGAGIGHYDASGNVTSSAIVNADVSGAAAIDGSKVVPAFGAQNISTTGTLGAGATAVTSLDAGSGTITTTGAFVSGAQPATVGDIRLSTGTVRTVLGIRNNTNTNDLCLIASDASNSAYIGATSTGTLMVGLLRINASSSMGLRINNSEKVSLSTTTTTIANNTTVDIQSGTTSRIKVDGTGIGFFAATPVAKQSITGALSSVTDANAKAVLTSIISALTNLGLVTNSTT